MKIEGNVKGRRYPVDSAPCPEQPRENGRTRICCICKRELPESEFSKSGNWHGYACRQCTRDYNAVYTEKRRAKKRRMKEEA